MNLLLCNINAIIFVALYMPVSYTHLDVYKRQILLWWRCRFCFVVADSSRVGGGASSSSKTRELVLASSVIWWDLLWCMLVYCCYCFVFCLSCTQMHTTVVPWTKINICQLPPSVCLYLCVCVYTGGWWQHISVWKSRLILFWVTSTLL